MTNISVIILTGKEELHIRRCLEKLAPLEPRQVFVVESQNGDCTHDVAIETAKSLGWSVCDNKQGGANPPLIAHHSSLITCFNAWPGMYGPQFNWALDNLSITSKWVLRLDADEYLEPLAIPELVGHLASDEPGVDAYALPLVRVWLGYRLKHGVETKFLTRVFRHGVGRCEDRAMDEHVSVPGKTVVLNNGFVDDNLNGFDWWREKHIGYAKREALDGVNRFEKIPWGAMVDMDGKPLSAMDRTKVKYYHLPPYLRVILYWAKRYFLGKGFLDGVGGWRWNCWQGLWYRWQVDREISRLKAK